MGTFEGVELKIGAIMTSDTASCLRGRLQPQRPPNSSCKIEASIVGAAKHEVTANVEHQKLFGPTHSL